MDNRRIAGDVFCDGDDSMTGITRIAVFYAIFALLASLANLATQAFVVLVYHGPWAIQISIAAGTLAGLPLKYVLEKRFIFAFAADSLSHDGRMFVLYSFMGVFTTALFWMTEWAFHIAFETDLMRYTGGAIGLTLGYVIKYQLDKRFVFVAPSRAESA